ncbi:uncharacterized protein DUF3347 [Chitinophaga dinghuensis]|uniref:Uncharacterized protein DUF3347 n=1 Tax=Chitinophaga dinghuensis TaxID=1539050 RepID=A0A327VZ27_9BACT|nr:DUF3347 domain-containing protein [Chitinophaga dinghuensis]RAJ82239.1 uncharacterized protein DUF3347 [Chitinophaga dinghuensis]
MKRLFFGAMALAAITLYACNNNAGETGATASTHEAQHTAADTKPSTPIKAVVDHYLHIKNGLFADNSAEAANGGKAMAEALAAVDKSGLTAEQQQVFTDNFEDLKEHAEHIGKNEGNIAHQREHFAVMSEDMYALVKSMGAGRTLYHDFCPMYNNNKGALWLSEEKELKNPYMGASMPGCGTEKEELK